MKTMDTTLLLTAIRMMAEYQPERLLIMAKEEPGELLEELEMRVGKAVGWTETAIGKGASREKMQEMMNLLLKPDGSSTANSEPLQISEGKILDIHRKLMALP